MEQELYLKLLAITFLSITLLGLMICSISSNIYAKYVGVLMWSSGYGQFDSPSDVAVDSSGYVFVADAGNNRIQVFADDLLLINAIIPPTVTITSPINGATLKYNPLHRICTTCPTLNVTNPINTPANVQITASTDNLEVKQVQFLASSILGGNVLLGTDTGSPYWFPLTNLSPDAYTLTAKAYDIADDTLQLSYFNLELI